MGRHSCLYYDSEETLLGLLHNFFEQGLKDNRLCLWVVPEWLGIDSSKKALKNKIKDLDSYIEKKQFEFCSHDEIYLNAGIFDPDHVFKHFNEMEKRVSKLGFKGLCISGDASWVEQEDWNKITAYEMEADRRINQKEIVALCTYPAKKFDIVNMFSLSFSHELILKRGDNEMDVLIDKRNILSE